MFWTRKEFSSEQKQTSTSWTWLSGQKETITHNEYRIAPWLWGAARKVPVALKSAEDSDLVMDLVGIQQRPEQNVKVNKLTE